jgi:hypothetical protein
VRTPSPYAHAPTAPAPTDTAGRSRSSGATATAVDVVARLGSLVTLAALLVLAATAGGLVDGVPATGAPTLTVTYER